jgi:hypothetical protein
MEHMIRVNDDLKFQVVRNGKDVGDPWPTPRGALSYARLMDTSITRVMITADLPDDDEPPVKQKSRRRKR